jgi:hypothetical protein
MWKPRHLTTQWSFTYFQVYSLGVQNKILLLLFILTANWVLPGGSGNTITQNKETTHITQNITTIKRNAVHKTTHTVDTLHKMNTNNHNYNYINEY